jgi:hypothetical protein
VVPVEEVGCTQDAESEEEVVVFEAAAAEVHFVDIAVPYHRETLSH